MSASDDTVRCEVCGNDVPVTEAVEQPYAEDEAETLGPYWWACRSCCKTNGAGAAEERAALIAEAVEALRAAGMTDAAEAIPAHPTSDTLGPVAQRLAFWIATERGDAKTRRALRAIAALAEHVGCGARVRTTIGKAWGRALSWLRKPRPETEHRFNGRRLAVRNVNATRVFSVQVRRKPFDVGPAILSWSLGNPATGTVSDRAFIGWGEYARWARDVDPVLGESYVVLCENDEHGAYRPCTDLVLVPEDGFDGSFLVYERGTEPGGSSMAIQPSEKS